MANMEQERQQRQNLEKILQSLSSIKVEDLARDDLGQEMNFRKELPYFDRAELWGRCGANELLKIAPHNT